MRASDVAWRKWVIGGCVLLACVAVGAVVARQVEYQEVVQWHQQFEQWREQRPLLTLLAGFATYFVLALVPVPSGKALLTAWLFGFWGGLFIISFATASAAAGTFLVSRYLFHDVVQARFGRRTRRLNEALHKEGVYYLFAIRSVPGMPFFLINVMISLTPMRLWTFWWVTQLAMLPVHIVLAYVGATFPDPSELQDQGLTDVVSPRLIFALALLGLFPLVARRLTHRWKTGAWVLDRE